MELLQILPVPLLLVITIAANLAANVTKKQYGSPACGGKDSAYIYSAVTSAICAVLMVAFAGFRISMSWYTLVLGLLYGVCTMLATVLLTKAMTIGPMSYSMVINSASTVITALSGFFFWNESLGALKIVGLVLMAGCFIFSVKKDDSGKRASLLWLVITLFSAVAGAGVGLLQKIHQSSAYRGELMGFLVIAFAFSFVASMVPYLWHRRASLFSGRGHALAEKTAKEADIPAGLSAPESDKTVLSASAENGAVALPPDSALTKPAESEALLTSSEDAENLSEPAAEGTKKRRKRWGRGAKIALLAVSGVAVAFNNVINLYLSGVMPSAVFFPLVNGIGLVLGIVAGLVIFREKLTPRQWIGIACGVAATLLLCL